MRKVQSTFSFPGSICKGSMNGSMNQKETLHELLTMDISGANIKSYGFDI